MKTRAKKDRREATNLTLRRWVKRGALALASYQNRSLSEIIEGFLASKIVEYRAMLVHEMSSILRSNQSLSANQAQLLKEKAARLEPLLSETPYWTEIWKSLSAQIEQLTPETPTEKLLIIAEALAHMLSVANRQSAIPDFYEGFAGEQLEEAILRLRKEDDFHAMGKLSGIALGETPSDAASREASDYKVKVISPRKRGKTTETAIHTTKKELARRQAQKAKKIL